jgi:hypothetical protein
MIEVIIRFATQALVANSQICPSTAKIVLDMHYTAKPVLCSVIELNCFIISKYLW